MSDGSRREISLILGGLTNAYYSAAYGFESLYLVDANLFALVFALALGLGVLAGLMPARRATRVDPVIALRHG